MEAILVFMIIFAEVLILLRLPEAYSLKGQKHLYIFDKFYSAIVEALNQCQIDEWVIWYGDAPSGLKGAQDLVYNILRKLL